MKKTSSTIAQQVAELSDLSRNMLTERWRKLAEEKGVQYAKDASRHRSDRYIWSNVKPTMTLF